MLLFFPSIVSALAGVALLGAGVAVHNVVLGAIGCLATALSVYRWLRTRGGAAK